MRTQRWPKNRAEVERLEREQYTKDDAERERRNSDEYESMREYTDRMRRDAEWDAEEAGECSCRNCAHLYEAECGPLCSPYGGGS